MKFREFHTRLAAVATELGFTPGAPDRTHPHPRLSLTYPGGRLFIVMPGAISDHRSFLNARAHLRRVARDVGLSHGG